MQNGISVSRSAEIVNMGITPEQFRQMQERVQKQRQPLPPAAPAVPVSPQGEFVTREFTYQGAPIGKPRMTRRDKWQQRPCVMRYRAFADGLRAAAGTLPEPADAVIVTAHVAMPASWSLKKKAAMAGKPCRQKPDWDNIGKAVCDALFDEDACIWFGVTMKYWCVAGEEKLKVKVLYAKPD